ncbi:hypothetical protein KBD87_00300 [Candidatus Saccharibacteria bacterium]|jgi:hypothetical protein|nr:hypothetical protein [Candidatus Saccharibacteria bacterium]
MTHHDHIAPHTNHEDERMPTRQVEFSDGTVAIVVDKPGTIIDFEGTTNRYLNQETAHLLVLEGIHPDGQRIRVHMTLDQAVISDVHDDGTVVRGQVVDRNTPGYALRLGVEEIGGAVGSGQNIACLEWVAGLKRVNYFDEDKTGPLPKSPFEDVHDIVPY